LLNFRYDLDEDFLTNVLPAIGLYAFAAIRLKPAVQVIFSGLTGLRYGRRIIDNYASYVTNSDTQIVESKIYDKEFMFKDSLVLKDVCFSYEGSENIIFNCLNVNIEHNTVVGIIGATGVGKTTFVDILLGLLKPSSGGVLIDGVNLNAFGLQNWHNSVGYVPQETIIHDLTIRENIALGVPIELIDEKRLIVCAKNAQIYDFINETNEGFDTILGDRGSRLSGGQKQRIGIARALYSDPDILVFDEATSALDQEVESELISEIVNLADKKTIIMIAHRHATLKCCDRIIELSKDEAKEVTYDDLILAKSR
jgi:ABC-type multidrug transport system fused ATPase/permease subunit